MKKALKRREPCIVCGKLIAVYADEPRLCYLHFKCPRCGGAAHNNPDDDSVSCSVCDVKWTDKDFVKELMEKLHRIKCPYCRGSGTIEASSEYELWNEST